MIGSRRHRTGHIIVALLVALVASAALVPGSSHAATTSVSGTGVYEKLVLANNQNTVVLKIFGPQASDCGWAVYATFRDRDGTRYTAERGCVGESSHHLSLMRGGLGGSLTPCGGMSYAYNSTGRFHRLAVPRSCLSGLADRIKVTQSAMQVGSPMPSEAGPTAYVARG